MDNINFENIKCSICEDYPRIIFEKNENKIMIKSYCYFHRDIKTYSLLGFIKKFIEKKDIEESNSNSISKDETNKLIKKTKYCSNHNNPYTIFSETEDLPICNYCYCEYFKSNNKIQKYALKKRYEIISDLIIKANIKLDYIQTNLNKSYKHLETIKNIQIDDDKEIKKYINEYIEENNNILKIIECIVKIYINSKTNYSVSCPIVKNFLELCFNFNPIPEILNLEKDEYKKHLIRYLENPNNYIINHHLGFKTELLNKDFIINPKNVNDLEENNKITRIIKLGNNKLCVGLENKIYIIYINLKETKLKVLFKIQSDLYHKERIWDIQLLSNGNIISISSDNICCIFKIDENKGELIGKISYEVIESECFNSFLILNDDYIAIHTYNILLIYKTPKNINGDRPIIKKRYTKINTNKIENPIESFSCLMFRKKEGDIISFFSILKGHNIINLWEFNLKTEEISEPFTINFESGIHYSTYIGSVCKFNNDFFLIGGYEHFGFYLVNYSNGKLYCQCIPYKHHYQGICVMPDNTFICGENYNNESYCIKRYQIFDKMYVLIDNICVDDEENSIQDNPISIVYLDNSNIIIGDYSGRISLWG